MIDEYVTIRKKTMIPVYNAVRNVAPYYSNLALKWKYPFNTAEDMISIANPTDLIINDAIEAM